MSNEDWEALESALRDAIDEVLERAVAAFGATTAYTIIGGRLMRAVALHAGVPKTQQVMRQAADMLPETMAQNGTGPRGVTESASLDRHRQTAAAPRPGRMRSGAGGTSQGNTP